MTIIIVLLFLLAGYIVLNILYRRTNHYNNPNADLEGYRKGVPSHIKLANFGTTFSLHAFDAVERWNISSFNFAINCESLELDLEILKYYSDRLEKGSVVILHILPCVLMYRLNMLDESRKKQCVIRGNRSIKITFADRIKQALPLFPLKIKKACRIFLDTEKEGKTKDGTVSFEIAERNAQGTANGWIRLFKLKNLNDTDFSETNMSNIKYNLNVIKEFIAYCKDNGMKVVIACPPMGSLLNAHFSDKFKNTLLGEVQKLTEEMNIPFVSYIGFAEKTQIFENQQNKCYFIW